jgi:hypothetical protein
MPARKSLYQIHTYHACLPTGLLRGVLNALGENLEDCSSDVRGSSFGQLCNIDIPVAQWLPGLSVLNFRFLFWGDFFAPYQFSLEKILDISAFSV